MLILQTAKINLFRRMRARRVGVPFCTRKDFRMPSALYIGDRKHDLRLPKDEAFESEFTEIFLDDEYRLEQVPPREIRTILDIGANVGLFSLAAKIFLPQAILHAYEPNPLLTEYLRFNTNSLGVNCYAEAIGLEDGRVSLIPGKGSGLVRTKLDNEGLVPQISFREAIKRIGGHVDLLKVDCEGAEWDIFKDADAWKNITYLTMEYHLWPKHPSVNDVKNEVTKLGFKIKRVKILSGYTGMIFAVRRK